MAQVNLPVSIDEKVKEAIEFLASPEKENRSVSNMTETLIMEALRTRKFDFKLLEKKRNKN